MAVKKIAHHLGLSLFISIVVSTGAYSCTTVFANAQGTTKAVARTMDLFTQDFPQLVIYPRGIKRDGGTGEKTLHWKSKYGNIVVSEFHTNAVSDGINEHGLAVHLLYLTSTVYAAPNPKKPTISNIMWAQYLLDNCSTVSEALQAEATLQVIATVIHGQTWPIHLAMEDASGDSAIIEYEQGHRHIYHGAQYNVMTNEPPFPVQLANVKRYKAFGGKLPLPGDTDPLSRFVRVATYLKTMPKTNEYLTTMADLLSVIRTAMVPFGAEDTSGNKTVDSWSTRWLSISDLTHKIYYFNSTTTPNIIWLEMAKLNFSQGAPVLTIDPNDSSLVGEVSKHLKQKITNAQSVGLEKFKK